MTSILDKHVSKRLATIRPISIPVNFLANCFRLANSHSLYLTCEPFVKHKISLGFQRIKRTRHSIRDLTSRARFSKVPITFRPERYFMRAMFTLKIQILLVLKAKQQNSRLMKQDGQLVVRPKITLQFY